MNAHNLAAFIWLVQKDIVWPDELSTCESFNADTQDPAFVDGEGIRILDFKGRDPGTGAVEALLVAGELFLGEVEDGLMERIVVVWGCR